MRGKWIYVSVGVFLAAVGGGFYFGVGPIDIAPASRDLPDAVKAYRATGFPWVAKDLQPSPSIPDSENAAPLLQQAIAGFDQGKFDKEEADSKGKPMTISLLLANGRFAEAVKRLDRYQQTFDLLAKATRMQGVDFHRDWDAGATLLFPEFSYYKAFIKLLCFRAQVEAGYGDGRGAAEDISRALKLCSFTGEDPTLIASLVQIAGEAITCRSAVFCAASLKDNPAALNELAEALQTGWTEPSFAHALRGEAYMGIAIMRNIDMYGGLNGLRKWTQGDQDAEQPHINLALLQRSGLPSGLLARAFLDRHLHYWTEVAKACAADPNDSMKIGDEMDKAQLKMTAEHKVSGLLDGILLPVFAQAGHVIVREEADHETTEALIQALIVKAKTGKLPTGIDQIPGTWTDPFSKKPLLVKTEGDSIRIYSIGPALKDLGGKTQAEAKGEDYNVAAMYPPSLYAVR